MKVWKLPPNIEFISFVLKLKAASDVLPVGCPERFKHHLGSLSYLKNLIHISFEVVSCDGASLLAWSINPQTMKPVANDISIEQWRDREIRRYLGVLCLLSYRDWSIKLTFAA